MHSFVSSLEYDERFLGLYEIMCRGGPNFFPQIVFDWSQRNPYVFFGGHLWKNDERYLGLYEIIAEVLAEGTSAS